MSNLLQGLRYSVRLLLKTPGFSLTAILVLALGIGANAAIFSLVNTLLLKPVAGSERPGQVVGIYAQDRTRPDSYKAFSYPAYVDVRDRSTSFSHVMAFTLAFVGIGEGEATRRTFGSIVTGNYFSTLGVDLLAGRTFTAEEERPDSLAAVTVVSYQYWKSHGGDMSMLGTTMRINARPFTVVGIAPPGFTRTSVLVTPEVWVPTGAADLTAGRSEGEDPVDAPHQPSIQSLSGRLGAAARGRAGASGTSEVQGHTDQEAAQLPACSGLASQCPLDMAKPGTRPRTRRPIPTTRGRMKLATRHNGR